MCLALFLVAHENTYKGYVSNYYIAKQRAGKLSWPKTMSERVKAVSTALATVKEPVTATEMAKRFARAKPADVGEILETLCAMGKARRGPPSAEATAGQAKADGTFLP